MHKINRLVIITISLIFIALPIIPLHNAAAIENNNAGYNVKLTSPNGGEQIKTLQDVTFQWTDNVTGFDKEYATIYIFKLKGDTWDLNTPYNYVDTTVEQMRVTGYPSNGFGIENVNKFTWKIPQFTTPGKYIAQVTITYWKGVNTDFGYITDYSDQPFTITTDEISAGAVPKITSLRPSTAAIGSEVFVTGTSFLTSNTVNLRSSTNGVALAESTTLSNTSLKFTVPSIATPGPYLVTVINSGGESIGFPLTVVAKPEGSAVAHPEGTNIKGTNGTIYRILDNQLKPYTSPGAFLSYKFNNWKTVVPGNSADLALPISTTYIAPRNGSLINDKGTVYLITNGKRAGFTSSKVFLDLGYSFSNVYPGDTSFMQNEELIKDSNVQHPYGTLVKDKGTIYVMIENEQRQAIPSMEVLDSWGYWIEEAVQANYYDQQTQVNAVEGPRAAWRMNI